MYLFTIWIEMAVCSSLSWKALTLSIVNGNCCLTLFLYYFCFCLKYWYMLLLWRGIGKNLVNKRMLKECIIVIQLAGSSDSYEVLFDVIADLSHYCALCLPEVNNFFLFFLLLPCRILSFTICLHPCQLTADYSLRLLLFPSRMKRTKCW